MKINHPTVCLAILTLTFNLSACQKSETPAKNEQSKASTQASVAKSDVIEIPAFPEDCQSVDIAIVHLKKTYSPEDLNKLNQLFKKCLTDVPLETRYQWMQQANLVYQFQISKLPKNVSDYITQLSAEVGTLNKNALAKLYQKMTPQEQYVAKNQKMLYLSQYNEGEGDYSVAQDPKYDLEIFAPFLPEADQLYVKESLKEYEATGGSIDKDAGLVVSFTQLGQWITFWENYLAQYPDSHFNKEVKKTILEYQRGLFLGAENTPVFEFDDYSVHLDDDADKAIHTLAKMKSPSGEKAKKFLNYFDNYKFTETSFDEKTGTQSDYNLFMNETLEGIQRFKDNYWKDLNQRLNLDRN